MEPRPVATLLTWRHRVLQGALRLLGPAPTHTPEHILPPRRILVVKVAGLGDGVMVRAIIEHLRKLRPALQIGVLVCPPTREVLADVSDFAVHCYDPKRDGARQLMRILQDVRRAQYDVAIDFEQYSILTPVFLRLAAVPVRVGFSNLAEPTRTRFLTHPLMLERDCSVWRNFVALAGTIETSLPPHLTPAPLPIGTDARAWTADWVCRQFHGQNGPLVAFHVGGSPRVPYKNWPVERFVALGEKLRTAVGGLRIVLSGTSTDRTFIDQFLHEFTGPVADASGLGSLQRTAALLTQCDLLVSNDTGIMHLGAAMGTPTVGLFGATEAKHWAPVGKRATYVSQTKVPCSPCSIAVDKLAPLSCTNLQISRCMYDITIEAVIAAARSVAVGEWFRL